MKGWMAEDLRLLLSIVIMITQLLLYQQINFREEQLN